ncbi:hypothetical protein BDF19DRAFT_432474 [Syncephalis fuscata]|nr:hypothetical protein BDF19DRAFT_432474 [Syncephalis fuscata]
MISLHLHYNISPHVYATWYSWVTTIVYLIHSIAEHHEQLLIYQQFAGFITFTIKLIFQQ